MIKNLLKEKILLEEPKLDDRRYLGDFEFEGVKYDITGEQSHTRNYNCEEIRIETSDFNSKVVGYGKYKWLNRPWQRFTFASALEQALINWQGHKKEAYEAINESSDCLEAVNKFIEKISKKETVNESEENNESLTEDADKVNGDEEVLPAAVPEEPIVVSSDPTPEIEKEEIDNGTYIMINDLVQKEWESINNIKSIIATLSAEENANQDVIAILESAVDEKTITVGMLTKASEIVDDKQSDLMQQGIEKAEEVVGEESAEDIDPAEKEFPVDESLKK